MKFNFPLNKDTVALLITGFVTFGFFFGGLFEILDFMILKILLILGFAIVFALAFINISKNSDKKNRPEEVPQDDLH